MYWVCFIEWYNENNNFRSQIWKTSIIAANIIFLVCALCAWHSLKRLFLSSDKALNRSRRGSLNTESALKQENKKILCGAKTFQTGSFKMFRFLVHFYLHFWFIVHCHLENWLQFSSIWYCFSYFQMFKSFKCSKTYLI